MEHKPVARRIDELAQAFVMARLAVLERQSEVRSKICLALGAHRTEKPFARNGLRFCSKAKRGYDWFYVCWPSVELPLDRGLVDRSRDLPDFVGQNSLKTCSQSCTRRPLAGRCSATISMIT